MASEKTQKSYGATETADGTIKYDTMFYGVAISDWVQNVHHIQAVKHGWVCYPLAEGSFGFDNLAHSISLLLEKTKDIKACTKDDLDKLADLVHQGWVRNYVYWRDNKPWVSSRIYHTPHNSLGDTRRNKCALTSYCDLDADEKDKDIIIASAVLELLGICSL